MIQLHRCVSNADFYRASRTQVHEMLSNLYAMTPSTFVS